MSIVPAVISHHMARGGAHKAGTLGGAPLERIEHFLTNHFKGHQVISAETGCGASTIIFAEYGHRHRAYCYDDSREDNSSVDYAKSYPGFKADHVDWVFGPTQHTLISKPPVGPLDMVLIDGPHGYPFPDVEYFFFYPHIRKDGILIIDDIHIPSITNLFKFLSADDMFYLDSVVLTTAFFRRTEEPTFSPTGDGWWQQRYNIQRFPEANPFQGPAIATGFDWRGPDVTSIKPYLSRGFTIFDDKLTSESNISIIDLPLTTPRDGKVEVEIDIEPLFTEQRPDAAVELFIDYKLVARVELKSAQTITLSGAVNVLSTQNLNIKMHHHGVRTFDALQHKVPLQMVDQRMLNAHVSRLSVRVPNA
jgi:Methyltransferase domain